MSDVTSILERIEAGDPAAAEKLLPLVYEELRKLAAAKLAHEKPGQTLQATALVHEAYLRLIGPGIGGQESGVGGQKSEDGGQRSDQDQPTPEPRDHRSAAVPATPGFSSRGHFFAAAAEAMRRILINRARDKNREKRSGGWQRVDLESIEIALDTPAEDLLALDEALQQLAADDKLGSDLVQLRFFAGLSQGEAAEALGMPRRTADRHWAYARAWLFDRLRSP